MIKKYDIHISFVLWISTLLFLVICFTHSKVFDWAYERHQNQFSWYIRPLFIIPFCYFSFRQSWSGIAFTVFCIVTSMFWFPKPDTVSKEVLTFLEYEKTWLREEWTFGKILQILTIPLSLGVLSMAFWKRSLIIGLSVIVLIAAGKITWSIYNAGASGASIAIPALTGLIVCCGLIFWGYRHMQDR